MSQPLGTDKRSRACKTCKKTGARNCAAAKLDLPICPDGKCHGLEAPITDVNILHQREALTRHLRPRKMPASCRRDPETGYFQCMHPLGNRWCLEHDDCARACNPPKIAYQPSRPRRCRKKCRASVPCPSGQCFASFSSVTSEARLHEYAGIHGKDQGAGNYWELAALLPIGERPHPARLDERNDMVRVLRTNLRSAPRANCAAKSTDEKEKAEP